jgi:hypothetical protein
MKQQAATSDPQLPVECEALCSVAVAVFNVHVNDRGLCPVCGCAWPCERMVLPEHNLAAL